MCQTRRLLVRVILSFLLSLGISHAGSMSMSPSTGSFGMRCVYPIHFSVNVEGIESKAVDMRVIYSGAMMQFTGAGTGEITYGTSLVRTGTSTVAINLGRASYIAGSTYRLFNRTDLITPLSGSSDISYYSRYFQTITNTLTGYLDFYYSGGWNGDDSNIQSGVVNNFVDVLDTINSGYYEFVARPCIPDTDSALFTGYASGATQSYLSGIAFTIYDFTGAHASGYNSTEHYYWNNANMTNYANYVAATPSDYMDNQYGVDSGTIVVSLSGLSLQPSAFTGEVGGYYSGGSLVYTSFTLASLGASDLFSCSPILTSVDMGNALTWNRLDRGYSCLLSSTGLVALSGVQLDSNQTILVTIAGADNPNYLSGVNTGTITFPITINGIDNTPPYITLSTYQWTGALNGFNMTGGGPLFAITPTISDREYRTKDNVELHLTGSETIIMTNVVGYSGTDLNVYISGGNGYSGVEQTLIFTGNMTGFLTFQDIPSVGMDPNYGQTYETGGTRYTYDFNVDVFRIDRITTQITGSLAYTGENSQLHHATLTLTGFATGNADSIKDDEFFVYAYSGVDGSSNYPNVTYVTGYSNTGYSLYHSGIVFNDNWTGYVYYRDRANNTGAMYLNVTGISLSSVFTFIAVPSDRADISTYGVTDNSGMIARIALISGLTYITTDPPVWTGEVLFEDIVKFSATGTYDLVYGLPNGSGYSMIVEGQSHLAQIMADVEITGNRTFDFRTVAGRITTGYQVAGDLSRFAVGENYLTTGAQKDGLITSDDLSIIVSWIQVGSYKLFSGGFFVHTGGVGKVELTDNTRYALAGYHPADLNADADVGLQDINLVLTYLDFQATYDRQAPKIRQYANDYFYNNLDY